MNEWQNDQKLVVNDARLRKIQISFEKLVRENYELKAKIKELQNEKVIEPLEKHCRCYGCEVYEYPGSKSDICEKCSRFYEDRYTEE